MDFYSNLLLCHFTIKSLSRYKIAAICIVQYFNLHFLFVLLCNITTYYCAIPIGVV